MFPIVLCLFDVMKMSALGVQLSRYNLRNPDGTPEYRY